MCRANVLLHSPSPISYAIILILTFLSYLPLTYGTTEVFGVPVRNLVLASNYSQ